MPNALSPTAGLALPAAVAGLMGWFRAAHRILWGVAWLASGTADRRGGAVMLRLEPDYDPGDRLQARSGSSVQAAARQDWTLLQLSP